jgi:Sulfatase
MLRYCAAMVAATLLMIADSDMGFCVVRAGQNAKSGAASRRPSILLIIPDQMRGQALGCMGNPDVRTPNLDRLAAQGLHFRNTFANTPVCQFRSERAQLFRSTGHSLCGCGADRLRAFSARGGLVSGRL